MVGWQDGGESLIIWLRGTLSEVTATALDGEFDLRAVDARTVVERRSGSPGAPRPGAETRRAQASAVDEDSFFALAMACADVGHRRLGDRPGAA